MKTNFRRKAYKFSPIVHIVKSLFYCTHPEPAGLTAGALVRKNRHNEMGIPATELEKILAPLPRKERQAWLEKDLRPETVEAAIRRARASMRRDLWVGIPWFLLYSASLFVQGFSPLTIGIFLVGVLYFTFVFARYGSYGLNRKRVQVLENLLNRLKHSS